MEQKLYDLLTNLVRLAIILAGIVLSRKRSKRKTTRRLPRNQATKGNTPQKPIEV